MPIPERDRWFQQWSSDMASDAGGSKIPAGEGPNENKATVSGRRKPRRGTGRGRVPGPTSGQTKKL